MVRNYFEHRKEFKISGHDTLFILLKEGTLSAEGYVSQFDTV